MPKKILQYIHCFKEISDMPEFKALMETNVYAIKGKVLVLEHACRMYSLNQ